MSGVHKRWMIFGGEDYYPSGGEDDFIDFVCSKIEVRDILSRIKTPQLWGLAEDACEWYSIFDIETETWYNKKSFIEKFGDL